jgi:hypothetical protein
MENLFWYYKQMIKVFIRAICAMNVFIGDMKLFVSWNGKLHLSPLENIFTIALINIHYLYMLLNNRSLANRLQVLKTRTDKQKMYFANFSVTSVLKMS